VIKVPIVYSSFEDFWEANDVPIGPSGNALRAMPAEIKAQLKSAVRKLLPSNPDGQIYFEAFANAVKGKRVKVAGAVLILAFDACWMPSGSLLSLFGDRRAFLYPAGYGREREESGMVARGIGAPDLKVRSSRMVWRVTTIRDGKETHDAVPYITKDDALRVVKSALDKGVIDSAYLVDPYGYRQEWPVVKKALQLP
jgi:hypothetical protein